MRLRRRREEKALSVSSSVLDAINNGWAAFPLLGGGSRQRITEAFNVAQGSNYAWMYAKSPAVRTVIDAIARNVGQLDLRLFEEVSDSERQPRPDHPAALSMRYPSEQTSSDSLIRALFTDYLIHDNAYAVLVPTTGNRLTIERIPAFMVEVQGSSLFRVENYRLWPQGSWTGGNWGGTGEPRDFPPDQVLHWHGENPLDPRAGISPLDTLRDVIAEDAALAQAIIELANNGLQSPIWASRPLEAPELMADTLRAREEDVTRKVRNRNRVIPMMTEGEQLQSFGVSPQDAQMLEIRRWVMQRIAALYGVPGGVVGLETPTPDSLASFYSDTLAVFCENFTRMLDQRILVRVYNLTEYTFEFNLDEKTGWSQLQNLISGAGVPLLTRNEGRAKLNLAPVAGGDEPITPSNVISGGKPSVDVMPIQDPNKPAQDGSYRTDQGPTPIPSGNGGKAVEEIEQKATEVERYTPLHPRQNADVTRQRENIAHFESYLDGYFVRLGRELKRTYPYRKANGRAMSRDWDSWTGRLSRGLHRLITDIMGAEGQVYATRFGGVFDMGRTVKYRKAQSSGAATAIIKNMRNEIEQLGLDATLARRSQHVASAGGSLGVKTTLFARREAARQSPGSDLRMERWIPDTDRHAKYGGVTVPLGSDWGDGIKPGSEPGCRCSSEIF